MRIQIIIFLQLIYFVCIGQSFQITDNISIRQDSYYDLLGKSDESVYFLKANDLGYEISKFNKDMKTSWVKNYPMKKKRPKFVDSHLYDDKIHVFHSYNNKSGTYLMQLTYNLKGNLIDSSTIFTIKDRYDVFNDLNVNVSENKRFVLFTNFEKANYLKFWIFDLKESKIINSHFIKTERPITYEDFHQFLVTDKGLSFFIISKENRRKKPVDHKFRIYKLHATNEKQINVFEMGMEGYLTTAKLFIYDNLNQQIIGGGLCSKESAFKADGSFYIKIPSNHNQKKLIKFQKLDVNTIIALEEVQKRKKNPVLMDMIITDMVARKDGGVIMICEEHKVINKSSDLRVSDFF